MRLALELIEEVEGHGTAAGLSLCGDVSLAGGEMTATIAGTSESVRDELAEGESTIGRQKCTITVPSRFSNVSRRHAKLTRTGETVLIEDIGSTYGTFVNGVQITGPTPVNIGDVIRLSSENVVYAEYRLVKIPD